MKQIIFTAILVLAFCFVAFAQDTKENVESIRIFTINSRVFRNETVGIKELSTAYRKIDDELRPLQNELDNLSAKIREINKNIPVLPSERWRFQDKIDELQKIQSDYDRKTESIKSIYKKRETELANPAIKKISDALAKFKKQKGYSIIWDVPSIGSHFLMDADSDVTAEFIQFYNSIYIKTIP